MLVVPTFKLAVLQAFLSLPFLFPFVLGCADALESRSILLDNAKLASFWLTANKSAVFYFFSWSIKIEIYFCIFSAVFFGSYETK